MKSRELRDLFQKTLWSRSFDGFVANVVIGKVVVVSELPPAFFTDLHTAVVRVNCADYSSYGPKILIDGRQTDTICSYKRKG
ncbi:hypothetical protein CTA1_4938 [Colletotrichum tanaceti]|uniref:Uncharacterized protein n=1 Tax=Colletotrichum tanaceti TaxID=1306861 RepID=A0A4U6XVV8_9PEZI|nr:hypothetical protein CTA1_4938 [Colletotrichum tanaceti]